MGKRGLVLLAMAGRVDHGDGRTAGAGRHRSRRRRRQPVSGSEGMGALRAGRGPERLLPSRLPGCPSRSRRRRPVPACPGRSSPPSAPSSLTAANPRPPACGPGPTRPAPKARCSSSRAPSRPTPPWAPAAPDRRARTTPSMPSTPRRPCFAPTAPAAPAGIAHAVLSYNHSATYAEDGARPHRRSWPGAVTADDRCGGHHLCRGTIRRALRLGRDRPRTASTARASSRPPTPAPVSPCLGVAQDQFEAGPPVPTGQPLRSRRSRVLR